MRSNATGIATPRQSFCSLPSRRKFPRNLGQYSPEQNKTFAVSQIPPTSKLRPVATAAPKTPIPAPGSVILWPQIV